MAKAKKKKAVKGKKELTTILSLFAIPNKQEKVIGVCNFIIAGKSADIKGNEVTNIDIATLDNLTSDPIKLLFSKLFMYATDKARWTIKNGYGLSIGLCDKVASYKAMIAYHKDNGINSLIVNGNKHFTYPEIGRAHV